MLFLSALVASVVAQTIPADTTQVTALPPNGNTFLLRVETEAIGGNFNAQDAPGNASVSGITVQFRLGGAGGTIVQPARGSQLPQFIGINGAPADTTQYVAVSFPSASTSNPTVFLCFNNSILFPGSDRCAQLVPIGASQLTRQTITLVQTVGATTPTCAGGPTGNGGCASCNPSTTQALSVFTVVSTVESLGQRGCEHAPLFVRGVHPCPVFIQRSVAPPMSDQAEVVQLVQSIPASTDTTTLNGVGNSFSLPRNIAYQLSVPPAAPVSGENRVYEALITNNGAAAIVTATDTFFVMFVNAAHRETATPLIPAGSGFSFANDASGATLFVEDSLGNVVHYIAQLQQLGSSAALTPAFVELPAGSYSVSAIAQTAAAAAGFGAVFNSAAVVTSGVSTQQLVGTANTYVIVALTTSGDPTSQFGISTFDVTPAAQGVTGVAEEQVINLFTSSNGGSSAGNSVGDQSVSLVQDLPTTSQAGVTQTTCRVLATVPPGSQAVVPANTNAAFDNTFASVFVTPATSSCAAINAFNGAGAVALGDPFASTTTCGRRVTLLVGRPYNVVSTVCTGSGNFANNVCSAGSASNRTTTEIGSLAFTGNTFFESNTGGTYSVFTVDVPSCTCAAGGTITTCPTPTPTPSCVCDLSSVTGSLSGLKTNVHNVLTVVKQIQKKVKKH